MIKISNKERNNQKELSTKCFLGITEKWGPFKKIGDHKLYTAKPFSLHKIWPLKVEKSTQK